MWARLRSAEGRNSAALKATIVKLSDELDTLRRARTLTTTAHEKQDSLVAALRADSLERAGTRRTPIDSAAVPKRNARKGS